MSDHITLQIESRTGVGTHAANKMRHQGRIPGVLYGHGESHPISLDGTSFRRQVSPEHYGSAVVTLQEDNKNIGSAIVKEVQYNTLKGQITHIDLQRVSAEDRVQVSIPVVLTGEPVSARTGGGVLEQNVHSINIRCRAADVPTEITFDVTPLELGESVHASQLALPAGSELLDKADEVIAVVILPNEPALEEPVTVDTEVSGPALTGEKQKDSFPPEK